MEPGISFTTAGIILLDGVLLCACWLLNRYLQQLDEELAEIDAIANAYEDQDGHTASKEECDAAPPADGEMCVVVEESGPLSSGGYACFRGCTA